jgi:hypothetical protein
LRQEFFLNIRIASALNLITCLELASAWARSMCAKPLPNNYDPDILAVADLEYQNQFQFTDTDRRLSPAILTELKVVNLQILNFYSLNL